MKKLMWLILLLGIEGMTFGLSKAWAQSGITQQNGRQVTCASDDMKRHLLPGRYQPRSTDDQSTQRLAVHPGADLGLQPAGYLGGSRLPGGFLPGDWLETRGPRRTWRARQTFRGNYHLLLQ